MIELALVLPVFFMILFGFIYFAMVLFQFCNITYASRAAMRYACLHSTANAQPASTANISTIVRPMIFLYPANTLTTTLTYSAGNIVGSTATVRITLSFRAGLNLQTTASGVVIQ